MEYIIERRYEYYSRSGKTWTKWFNYKSCKTKEQANELIKKLKKTKELTKNLKGEYKLKEN